MWLVVDTSSGSETDSVFFPLKEGEFYIGRDSSCDMVIAKPTTSRKHVKIVRSGNLVEFRDLRSSSGTFLNGVRTDVGQLEPGDRLTVDGVDIRYERKLAKAPRSREADAGSPYPVDWRPFGAFLEKLRRSSDPKDLLERLLLGLVDIFGAERGRCSCSSPRGALGGWRVKNNDAPCKVAPLHGERGLTTQYNILERVLQSASG